MAGQAFEITARTLLGEQVTSFSSPFVLIIYYDTLPLGGVPPLLYFWRESDGVWVEIPSVNDPSARTLTATLDHLTTMNYTHAMARVWHRGVGMVPCNPGGEVHDEAWTPCLC
jgi:hypothetical protein